MKRLLPILLLLAALSGCDSMKLDDQLLDASYSRYGTIKMIYDRETDGDPSNDVDWSGLDGRAIKDMLDSWAIWLKDNGKEVAP